MRHGNIGYLAQRQHTPVRLLQQNEYNDTHLLARCCAPSETQTEGAPPSARQLQDLEPPPIAARAVVHQGQLYQ